MPRRRNRARRPLSGGGGGPQTKHSSARGEPKDCDRYIYMYFKGVFGSRRTCTLGYTGNLPGYNLHFSLFGAHLITRPCLQLRESTTKKNMASTTASTRWPRPFLLVPLFCSYVLIFSCILLFVFFFRFFFPISSPCTSFFRYFDPSFIFPLFFDSVSIFVRSFFENFFPRFFCFSFSSPIFFPRFFCCFFYTYEHIRGSYTCIF